MFSCIQLIKYKLLLTVIKRLSLMIILNEFLFMLKYYLVEIMKYFAVREAYGWWPYQKEIARQSD